MVCETLLTIALLCMHIGSIVVSVLCVFCVVCVLCVCACVLCVVCVHGFVVVYGTG